jgi:hypothetical protein
MIRGMLPLVCRAGGIGTAKVAATLEKGDD